MYSGRTVGMHIMLIALEICRSFYEELVYNRPLDSRLTVRVREVMQMWRDDMHHISGVFYTTRDLLTTT
jgi:hypothetical protein